MIDRLTEEQERRIAEYRERYWQQATSTEPADRPRAQAAARAMAELEGIKIERCIWLENTEHGDVLSLQRASLAAWTRNSLAATLECFVTVTVYETLRDSLETSLNDLLKTSQLSLLVESLRDSLVDSLWDTGWLAFYTYAAEVLGVEYLPEDAEKLRLHNELASSCFALWLVPGTAILCERPAAVTVAAGRLVGFEWLGQQEEQREVTVGESCSGCSCLEPRVRDLEQRVAALSERFDDQVHLRDEVRGYAERAEKFVRAQQHHADKVDRVMDDENRKRWRVEFQQSLHNKINRADLRAKDACDLANAVAQNAVDDQEQIDSLRSRIELVEDLVRDFANGVQVHADVAGERWKIISETEVRDTQTGLVWRRDFEGPMNWYEAKAYAASLGNGWRLPDAHELFGIVDLSRSNSAIDVVAFPNTPAEPFWTATDYAAEPSSAWDVYFDVGYVGNDAKSSDGHVRCVRRGP